MPFDLTVAVYRKNGKIQIMKVNALFSWICINFTFLRKIQFIQYTGCCLQRIDKWSSFEKNLTVALRNILSHGCLHNLIMEKSETCKFLKTPLMMFSQIYAQRQLQLHFWKQGFYTACLIYMALNFFLQKSPFFLLSSSFFNIWSTLSVEQLLKFLTLQM